MIVKLPVMPAQKIAFYIGVIFMHASLIVDGFLFLTITLAQMKYDENSQKDVTEKIYNNNNKFNFIYFHSL